MARTTIRSDPHAIKDGPITAEQARALASMLRLLTESPLKANFEQEIAILRRTYRLTPDDVRKVKAAHVALLLGK